MLCQMSLYDFRNQKDGKSSITNHPEELFSFVRGRSLMRTKGSDPGMDPPPFSKNRKLFFIFFKNIQNMYKNIVEVFPGSFSIMIILGMTPHPGVRSTVTSQNLVRVR